MSILFLTAGTKTVFLFQADRDEIYGKLSQKMIDVVMSLSALPPELHIKQLSNKSF